MATTRPSPSIVAVGYQRALLMLGPADHAPVVGLKIWVELMPYSPPLWPPTTIKGPALARGRPAPRAAGARRGAPCPRALSGGGRPGGWWVCACGRGRGGPGAVPPLGAGRSGRGGGQGAGVWPRRGGGAAGRRVVA